MKKFRILSLLTMSLLLALCGCGEDKKETDLTTTESETSAKIGESAQINTDKIPAGFKLLDENAGTLSDGTQLAAIIYDLEGSLEEYGEDPGDPALLPGYTMLYTDSEFDLVMFYSRECIECDDLFSLDETVQDAIIRDLHDLFLNYPVSDYLEAAYKAKTDDADPKTGSSLMMDFTSGEIKEDILTVHMSTVFDEGWEVNDNNRRMELVKKLSEAYANSDLSAEEQQKEVNKLNEELEELVDKHSENNEYMESGDYQYNVTTGERLQ